MCVCLCLTSNWGQFMPIPGPCVFLHHFRSSLSLAELMVWPRSRYRALNLIGHLTFQSQAESNSYTNTHTTGVQKNTFII